MDYRGKIITLSRFAGDEPADYVCTAHYGTIVEVVPATAGEEHVNFIPLELGDSRLERVVYESRDDQDTIDEVKARCAARVRSLENQQRLLNAIFGRADSVDLEGIRANLAKLHSLDGDQPVKRDEPTPENQYRAAKDAMFAAVYGGCCCRPNYRGKIVFVEIPLEYDEDASGEFIVVQQSEDSLYVVDTNSCTAGCRISRLPFSAGEDHLTVLDSYEDDAFIREFIDRLDDMDTEDYTAWQCDAAETVSRTLARMLERKDSNTLLDKVSSAPLFFGPIGTADRKQAEGRCNRPCKSECCV